MTKKEFGDFLRKHRIQSGYESQRKLGKVSGISSATISRIEKEVQKPSPDTLKTLAKYLTSTTFDQLMDKVGYVEGAEINFINNPIEIIVEIIEERYPETKCDVYFGDQFTDGEETFSCTIFPENEQDIPCIEIHPSLSVQDMTEILVHELAHVIAGEENGHNQTWINVFDQIYLAFHDKLSKRCHSEN